MSDRICLVVEDEPTIRKYLRLILERDALQTLEAGTAAEALKIIHKLDGQLDLIVSDINMPGEMDGLDLAHSVRNTFPAIPIILITGYDNNAMRASGFDLLRKPFASETILEVVRRLVGAVEPKHLEVKKDGKPS